MVAYLAAFGCAFCYGGASILQSVGAHRLAIEEGFDPRLLVRLARQGPYLAGLGLDLAGWLLSLLALRWLPLFAVQAILAGSIGVTAVLAAVFLGARPRPSQIVALVGLGLGLVLLAVTAQPGSPSAIGGTASVIIAIGTVPVALLCVVAARTLHGARAAAILGALSGLAFGGTAICARALQADVTLRTLFTDPLLYGLAVYGLLGMTVFAMALQRGPVTLASAGQVAAETVVPAAIGLAFLGDHARPGTGLLAAAGFVLAVGAAFSLATRIPAETDATIAAVV